MRGRLLRRPWLLARAFCGRSLSGPNIKTPSRLHQPPSGVAGATRQSRPLPFHGPAGGSHRTKAAGELPEPGTRTGGWQTARLSASRVQCFLFEGIPVRPTKFTLREGKARCRAKHDSRRFLHCPRENLRAGFGLWCYKLACSWTSYVKPDFASPLLARKG